MGAPYLSVRCVLVRGCGYRGAAVLWRVHPARRQACGQLPPCQWPKPPILLSLTPGHPSINPPIQRSLRNNTASLCCAYSAAGFMIILPDFFDSSKSAILTERGRAGVGHLALAGSSQANKPLDLSVASSTSAIVHPRLVSDVISHVTHQ